MKIEVTPTSTRAGLRKYLYQGIVSFLVIAASVIFFFLLFRMDAIQTFFGKIFSILQPIILGLVIAYILNPVVTFFEHKLLQIFLNKAKNQDKAKRIIRSVSIFISLIIACVIVYILGSLILPQLYVTIVSIIKTLPSNITLLSDWVESLTISNKMVANYIDQMIEKATLYFQQWAQGDLLPQLNIWATYFANGLLSFLNVLKNLIIGLIISIYVLTGKEKFCAQSKMIVYAIFHHSVANEIIEVARESNRIFSRYIIGAMIDASIVGVLCFIGLSILNVPYALLISVIVGCTNIIPFFGPYIGAIPSALFILVTSPIHALYFIIFVLVLQQIDGNIISPKILGDSTGLSAFWVVFSILLGGGLFGLLGMLIGVPTFAVIYYVISRIVSSLLAKKKLRQTSEEYEEIECIQWKDGNVIYIPRVPFDFQAGEKTIINDKSTNNKINKSTSSDHKKEDENQKK